MDKRSIKLYDEKGKELKDGQLVRVFHFTGARNKKNYMYKQISKVEKGLYAMHLPVNLPCTDNNRPGYWPAYEADADGIIEGTRIVQCYCDQCIWGAKRCY